MCKETDWREKTECRLETSTVTYSPMQGCWYSHRHRVPAQPASQTGVFWCQAFLQGHQTKPGTEHGEKGIFRLVIQSHFQCIQETLEELPFDTIASEVRR